MSIGSRVQAYTSESWSSTPATNGPMSSATPRPSGSSPSHDVPHPLRRRASHLLVYLRLTFGARTRYLEGVVATLDDVQRGRRRQWREHGPKFFRCAEGVAAS